MKVLETERLLLRTWEEKDAEPYFQMNQDPQVIEFLRGSMTRQEVETFMQDMNRQFEERGFTFWAVEEKSTGVMIGWIGLNVPSWQAHFSPHVDIGWRLGAAHWGKGYATEAARACIQYGFEKCQLKEIVSFTVPDNIRSRHVMDKIGMHHDPKDDFRHPLLPEDHKCSFLVLYRIQNPRQNLRQEAVMKFGYTIIYVHDVEKTVEFYQKAFGLPRKFLSESKQYAELDTGSTALAFASEKMQQSSFKPNRAGELAAGFEIALVSEDVQASFEKAVKNGATAVAAPVKKPWGQTVAYVTDCNGVFVEICNAVCS